ncbi:hypothetical protein CLH62_04965 [Marinobacter guineae]|uniref:Uncharacterized protein n=1 Tax=Marinobacter guineae TaxID=432303 RepID=A0A2G1VLA7_9GAMM|nr:hypothetical protein CLH62_04965 [Marinobacter guineae]
MPGALIPFDQWKAPETSVRRSLKDAFRHALAQIRAGVAPEAGAFESLDSLPELSRSKLQTLAPQPDYPKLAGALLRSLEDARSDGNAYQNVTFLVAAPFSGIRSALGFFPELEPAKIGVHGPWSVIVPPENLLVDDQGAREWWGRQDLSTPWVIPELADFWLRHLSGLALIRELLRRVAAGGLGPGVIGCSSWCWQFWSAYFQDVHFAPLTPEPLDAAGIGAWFEFHASQAGQRTVIVRMTDDGHYVLPMAEQGEGKKRKHSRYLRDLASAARGNPGVALAIWQRSLRARPEEEAQSEDPGQGVAESTKVTRFWVVPFDQLGLPIVPQTQGDNIGLVLHALLLHDGLNASSLALVTGIPEGELSFILARLARSELIEQQAAGEGWMVTALGYPSIRRHLDSWGFPVDML